MPKYYEVYNAKTGELLAEGTTGECAGKLGILPKSFSEIVRSGSRKYDIVKLEDPETEARKREKAIRDWDETVKILRKQLGLEE